MVAPGIAGVNRNLYEVLGVARDAASVGIFDPRPGAWEPWRLVQDASLSAIRAAYRKLAVQLHPDKGPGPAALGTSLEPAGFSKLQVAAERSSRSCKLPTSSSAMHLLPQKGRGSDLRRRVVNLRGRAST